MTELITLRAMESRNQAAVRDVLSETNTTGYIITELEKLTDIPVRKALIDLLGSDLKRMSSILAIGSLAETYERLDMLSLQPTFKLLANGLNSLKRVDVYRIFSVFPRDLTPQPFWPNCTAERQELKEVTFLYAATGLWLIDNLRGGKHSDTLSALGLEHEKKRAFVAEKRYDVCDWVRRTTESQYVKAFSVPALWLLWEISICRNRLNDRYTHKHKRAKYDFWVNVWEKLDDFGTNLSPCLRQPVSTSDLVESFEAFMLTEARAVAAKDPGIDRLVYKAYIEAERTWGRKNRDGKGKVTPYL